MEEDITPEEFHEMEKKQEEIQNEPSFPSNKTMSIEDFLKSIHNFKKDGQPIEEPTTSVLSFEVDQEGAVYVKVDLVESVDTKWYAKLIHKLNGGELLELILKAVLNFGNQTGKMTLAQNVVGDLADISREVRPAVRPLQVFKGRD